MYMNDIWFIVMILAIGSVLCFVVPKISNRKTLKLVLISFFMSYVTLNIVVTLALSNMEELDYNVCVLYDVSSALLFLCAAVVIIKCYSIRSEGKRMSKDNFIKGVEDMREQMIVEGRTEYVNTLTGVIESINFWND